MFPRSSATMMPGEKFAESAGTLFGPPPAKVAMTEADVEASGTVPAAAGCTPRIASSADPLPVSNMVTPRRPRRHVAEFRMAPSSSLEEMTYLYGVLIARARETTASRYRVFTLQAAAPRGMKDWCERRDSNPHGLPHRILSPARLPVPPLSQI